MRMGLYELLNARIQLLLLLDLQLLAFKLSSLQGGNFLCAVGTQNRESRTAYPNICYD
jgi:hypothetical protein